MTDRFDTVAPWSLKDNLEAEGEGWALFNIETDPVIQKDDELGVFESDDDAIDYVIKWARAGSLLHARALQLHYGAVGWDWDGAYGDTGPEDPGYEVLPTENDAEIAAMRRQLTIHNEED